MMLFYCLLILLFGNLNWIKCDNRLPQALKDEDYELLIYSLENNEIKTTRQRTNQDRRIARLYLSGQYKLEKIYNPMTNNEEILLVSLLLLLIFFSGPQGICVNALIVFFVA